MDTLSHFNIENNFSLSETDESLQLVHDNYLVNFIGHPFNYQINPELENTHNFYMSYYKQDIPSNNQYNQSNIFSVKIPKKRGRTKTSENTKSHDKFDEDNIVRKLQVSYINFVTNFMNEVIKKIGRQDLRFISLNYLYKRKVNKAHRLSLKIKTIEEVLSHNISPKFRKKDTKSNKETCEIIKKENINILINILNKKIFFFFDKIYFKNYRNFNLKEFGLDDLEIQLPPTIELFEDLLNKNKKEIHFEEYKKRINKYAKKHFVQTKKDIFKCNY